MNLERIDHICIAVKDVKKAEETYAKAFDLQPILRYVEEKEKINVVRFMIGEVAFEVLEATDPDSDVGRFIERKGEGVFLISFKVPDVADSIAELNGKGIELIDKTPRRWRDSNYAFCRPKDFNNVLIELID